MQEENGKGYNFTLHAWTTGKSLWSYEIYGQLEGLYDLTKYMDIL